MTCHQEKKKKEIKRPTGKLFFLNGFDEANDDFYDTCKYDIAHINLGERVVWIMNANCQKLQLWILRENRMCETNLIHTSVQMMQNYEYY